MALATGQSRELMPRLGLGKHGPPTTLSPPSSAGHIPATLCPHTLLGPWQRLFSNMWQKPLDMHLLRPGNSTQRSSSKVADLGTKVNRESFIVAKNGNNQVFNNRKMINSIKVSSDNGILCSY